jgi:hypothetical protein
MTRTASPGFRLTETFFGTPYVALPAGRFGEQFNLFIPRWSVMATTAEKIRVHLALGGCADAC